MNESILMDDQFYHHHDGLGRLIGVGVGPGDPELITIKAARHIEQADVLCYVANENGESQALTIVQSLIDSGSEHLPVVINMFTGDDRCQANSHANQAYDLASEQISEQVKQGKKVVFLCEGDPLFYGSFGYVLERLKDQVECAVVPGITSVNSASAVMQTPLTMLRESFLVLPGYSTDVEMAQALAQHDTVVIMKAGKARPKILAALAQAQRTQDACYLEYISRAQQKVEPNVSLLANEPGPYFSLFVVTANQRVHR